MRNSKMTDRARRLRRDATPPEQIMWSVLRGRRLGGLKFRRQEPIGPYIVDFCCRDLKLVIEVDGMSHDDKQDRDQLRDRWLGEQGYRVLRVTNWDVNEDLEAVARLIGEIGPTENRRMVLRCQENGEWPAAASLRQQLVGLLIYLVQIRALLPVHLDIDEVIVHHSSCLFVLE